MILFVIAISLTIFSLGYFIADLVTYIGSCIVLASPRENNTTRKVDGVSVWPLWLMMLTAPYIVWFLMTH